MAYLVAAGHGVALVSLVAINPQPRGGGVMPVQRNYSVGGDVHEIGKWAQLEWDALEDGAEYLALLTQFGLNSALNSLVTVYLRNEFYAPARYNATAIRPEMGADIVWNDYFPRNIKMILKDLVAL